MWLVLMSTTSSNVCIAAAGKHIYRYYSPAPASPVKKKFNQQFPLHAESMILNLLLTSLDSPENEKPTMPWKYY